MYKTNLHQTDAPESYDFDEQFRRAHAWEKATGKTLFRISDWNSKPDEVTVPLRIINNAIEESIHSITYYAETEQIIRTSNDIQKGLVSGYDVAFAPHVRTHLFGNTTQAIFGVMFAIRKIVTNPKILFIHPSYYSAMETSSLLGIPVIEMWRKRRDQFVIDIEKIDKIRKAQSINVIFLTDPVYSAGVCMCNEEWNVLVNYCEHEGIWIVLDMAFSGLSWLDDGVWIDRIKLMRANYKKSILIDSPSKRLFINNIKIAVVFADVQIINALQEFQDSQLGNLAGLQLYLAKRLFEKQNKDELEVICKSNADRAYENFLYIQGIVSNSDHVFFEKPNGGFHALAFSINSIGENVDVMNTCQRWVTELETLAIPINDFRFDTSDEFGVRVNLMITPQRYEHIIKWIATNGMLI